MKKRLGKKIVTLATVSALVVGCMPMNVFAYGEEVRVDNSTFRNNTDNDSDYQDWLANVWNAGEKADSGKIALTPGNSEKDLNFAWYSEDKGITPAIKIWTVGDEANAKLFKGTATEISTSNLDGVTYEAYNHVSIEGYFKNNTEYKYQYTDNYNGSATEWSEAFEYSTADVDNFSVIVTGDPQVGASGGDNNKDISRDTYNWNKTVETAASLYSNAALLLSVGDQVDWHKANDEKNKQIRESEYAGYLYPGALRSIPVAATIGNHDTMGVDYSQHFNNPNTESKLGWTEAGYDFYFSYGDVLFICLNSNNRNQAEHRVLMEQAVASNPDAKWRIAYFHIDIYGSSTHSDTDATANRIIFAPLMDEFDIDICLNGHDHTYSRSYQILDGNVINYDITDAKVVNPEGTLYVTTGSASGSKYYDFVSYKQYYLADRTNVCLPTFSALEFTEDSVKIKTFDYNGDQYADTFTISKTASEASVEDIIAQAEEKLGSDVKYTAESLAALKTAVETLKGIQTAFTTAEDTLAAELTENYRTADDRCVATTADGSTLGYGHVKSSEDMDFSVKEDGSIKYYNRFKKGLSTLLDKTLYTQNFKNVEDMTTEEKAVLPIVDANYLESAKSAVVTAMSSLKVVSNDENNSSNSTDGSGVTDADKTGDATNVWYIIAGMLIVGGLGLVVTNRKKEENC